MLRLMIKSASPEACERGAKIMAKVPPTTIANPDWLTYAVNEGFLEANEIWFEDEQIGVIWFSGRFDGGLHINAVAAFDQSSPNIDIILAAIEVLAKGRNSKYIDYNTNRLGLIHQTTRRGYKITNLTLRKYL